MEQSDAKILPFRSSMDFPTGLRQPSQRIAEDLILAATPDGLLDRMKMDALEKGSPIHDQFYMGHDPSVQDTPLSQLFMHQIEKPFHMEDLELPKGILGSSPSYLNYCLVGNFLVTVYLRVGNLFEAKADSTFFKLETTFTEVKEGYEDQMVQKDYSFMDYIHKMCDHKIKNKFPDRKNLMACKHNTVR